MIRLALLLTLTACVTCANCGRPPAPGMQLVSTVKGRLCNTCQRDFRAGHRGAS